MAFAIDLSCIGCGACESICPHGAITQSEAFPVTYLIDPLRCDDCKLCVAVCPVDAIAPDPAWAVCYGRGCPLSSSRYAGWECSVGEVRCEICGSMLWRETLDSPWVCSRCRLGEGGKGASCPKVRHSETVDSRSSAQTLTTVLQ